MRLGDIDYLVLVGGSSRVPLVRDMVRAAFCNPSLPEHVRHPEPLLERAGPVRRLRGGPARRHLRHAPSLPRPEAAAQLPARSRPRARPGGAGAGAGSPRHQPGQRAGHGLHAGRLRARPRGGGGAPRRVDPRADRPTARLGRGVPRAGRRLRPWTSIAAPGATQRPGADAVRQRRSGTGELPGVRAARAGGAAAGAGRPADAAHHQAVADRGPQPGPAARQAGRRSHRRHAARRRSPAPAAPSISRAASSCRSSRRTASSSRWSSATSTRGCRSARRWKSSWPST